LVGLSLVGTLGCATRADEDVDGRDDSFTSDGKLDGFTCTAAEAAAILQAANTATRATLKNDVGLADKAVDNIIAVREGDDEHAGTADDVELTSLAQLDAIPYIGPTAFGKLLQYVHDADLVPDAAPHQWTSSTFANGDDADFAITPDGKPVVVYKGASGFVLRQPNGSTLAIPMPAGSTGQPQVAVDSSNMIHVLFPVIVNPQSVFKHLTVGLTGTSFTTRDDIPADILALDAGPAGQVYALAQRHQGTSLYSDRYDASLVTFGANGATSIEPLWEMYSHASVAFNVGSDGFPALAWAGSGSGYTALRYARRGDAGWQELHVDGGGTFSYPHIATTGTANATVIIDGHSFHQSGQTLSVDDRLQGQSVGSELDAQADDEGVVHACLSTYSNGTVDAEMDATGPATITSLGQGGCWLGLDKNGKLHRLYALGTVLNHAVYE
jgi:hypothetical protein